MAVQVSFNGGGAEGSFPAIKKDGRARGFQHSRWPRCTAAGDWPRQQEAAVPRGGTGGAFSPGSLCRRDLEPTNDLGVCGARDLELDGLPLRLPAAGSASRSPAPAGRRTHLAKPWGQPR